MSKTSRFRPAIACTKAWFTLPPAFTKGKRPRGSKRLGYNFERRVGEELEKLFPGKVVSNAWIGYDDFSFGERICSPDHMIIDVEKGEIIIVECKLTHTQDAWKQLNDVYYFVVAMLFPGFKIHGIEVCKNYEASKDYPVVPNIISRWSESIVGGDNVMVWRL